MSEKTVRMTLRLPEKLHDVLVAAAERDRRSLNAEIVVRLERSIAQEIARPRRS